ncbi:putative glucosyl-1-phosphate transferase [Candidatus Kuenenia stuttgartiensis]|uniref:Putative glucosyl-1-phosphate transferase n=1 Tax=Kuenenia stuttgartiensis TaxID=174633 RepID=Q1Q7K9_KUEST|nr:MULTISPECIES: sugar transferase [Kuenenia]MCZ7622531.1 sugar transferase [Candidatus Kuenenia sp.]QII13441.1 putative glucosyl-1-phosphate transferase [Candidatus Kuenenia stuttgartiensis]CAJ70809.1 similar to glucosyl-1-phosphate transferase [Candidatus Kuenenia stuttgartiensis]
MLKEYHLFFRRLMICFDLFIVTISFFLSPFLFSDYGDVIQQFGSYFILLPALLSVWGIFLHNFGMYESFRTKNITEVIFPVIETALVGGGLLGSFVFLAKIQTIGSEHLFYSFFMATILLCGEKVSLLFFMQYQRKNGFNTRNILIVGTGKRAQHFINTIGKNVEWGINVIGLIDNDAAKKNTVVCGNKVIGAVKDIPAIIHKTVVDEVMFVVPRSWLNTVEEMIRYLCDIEGLKVSVAVDLFTLNLARTKYSHVTPDTIGKTRSYLSEFPLLVFESAPDKLLQLFIKRLMDIIFSGIALVSLFPVFLIIAIAIKTTSNGPLFFKQKRCSLNGRVFKLYKFRTMVADAEAKRGALLKNNEMQGPVFKMSNDPRVTKIGKFLRKYSIDEFPQFWNVLKGDMSLVGPRPPIPKEVDEYEPWHRRRLSMRPGLTCIWQVSGRNKITNFDEWMRLDLEYIDNWSVWLDFKILFGTVPAVLAGSGAK